MIRVDTSTILDAPIDEIWALIRDFNSHQDWHPAIATSVIEDGRAGDAVGAIRSFSLTSGEHLREQLTALSDETYSFSYRILTSDVPLLNYQAHVMLKPVTASARTFWRWWSTFEVPQGQEAQLTEVVRDGVYHAGFDAVAERLGRTTDPRPRPYLSPVAAQARAATASNRKDPVSAVHRFRGARKEPKMGFNLLLWGTQVGPTQLRKCEMLAQMGWDGVEIPIFGGTPTTHATLGNELDDLGLKRTAVATISAGDTLSNDPHQRQRAIDHMKHVADCSLALGAEVLAGPLTQPLATFSGQGITSLETERLHDASRALADHTRGTGLTIAVEPLNRFECYALNTTQQAADLVKAVDLPHYGYLFDSFHANIEETDPWAALRQYADHMTHVHVSENHRGTPGDGHIDFAAMFAVLHEIEWSGWITVEAFGQALPDIAAATKIWRPVFENDDQLCRDALAFLRRSWANAAANGRRTGT